MGDQSTVRVEFLTQESPDAILLDLQLPDSNGLDSLAKVHSRATNVPVIVLTELNDESLGLQAIKSGAQDYLAKLLLTGDILERCLRYAIERNRMVRSIRRRDAELARLTRMITSNEMVSGLAHELKQPLTAIKNYAEASIFRLADVEHVVTQRVTENLSAISRQASHASDIICHMKSFVAKSVPKVEAASLDNLICGCLSLLDHEIRREGVDVVLQFDTYLPSVWVDCIQIKQVMLNLICNSIESVAASGTEHREISIRTFVENDREANFVVSDTGLGFAPNSGQKIFEPFYSTKKGGMGMGLAICTSIVEAHGGRIEARRNANGGAEFCVALPLACGVSRSDSEILPTAENTDSCKNVTAKDADAIAWSL